jgi:hypothetical protein
MFTSSVAGAQPLVALDGTPIGSGLPGPVWRRIRQAREEWIDATSLVGVGAGR